MGTTGEGRYYRLFLFFLAKFDSMKDLFALGNIPVIQIVIYSFFFSLYILPFSWEEVA